MTLRTKIAALLVTVAVLAAAISTGAAVFVRGAAERDAADERLGALAAHGASTVGDYLTSVARQVQAIADSVVWEELSDEEREGVLTLVYRQLEHVAAVSAFDAEGAPMGPSIHSIGAAGDPHPMATLPMIRGFAARIPLRAALRDGAATGEPFRAGADALGGTTDMALSVAVRVNGRENAGGATPRVLAVLLVLRSLCQRLAEVGGPDARVYAVEPGGSPVCAPHDAPAESPAMQQRGSALGWRVVAEASPGVAAAAAGGFRARALFWGALAALIAIIAGWVLSREIEAPLRRLAADAGASSNAGDAVSDLGHAIGQVRDELERMRGELRAKDGEMEAALEARTRALRESYEELVESHKMAAVVSLGAGIAHEINNPLTGVLGLTQILLRDAKSTGDTRSLQLLRTVEHEALRIKGLIVTLLTFSNSCSGLSVDRVDLNDALAHCLKAASRRLEGGNISVVRELDAALPPVMGDRGQLQQAFLHIINNACAAMTPGGGALTFSSRTVDDLIQLQISDTGRGIPREHLDHIFEPFFTTESPWEGRGLGLTVAQKILAEHRGRIRVSSEVGRGTTLTISLPAADTGTSLS